MLSDYSTIKLKINNEKITHTFGNLNILINNLGSKIKQRKLWQRGFNRCKWLTFFAKHGLVRRTWLGRWYSCWVLAFYDSSLSSSLQVTGCCLRTNEQCIYCFYSTPLHHSFSHIKISQLTVGVEENKYLLKADCVPGAGIWGIQIDELDTIFCS